jgi:GNAT superfamily N-acetyltransferase
MDVVPNGNVPASIRIEAVGPSDLAILVNLCAEHAHYERAAFDPAGKAELLVAALFSNPARLRAWIAWNGDQALGYASASREFSTWSARNYLHLDCLFLREAARGRGIGTALLRTAIGAASAEGLCELQWQTPDWNEPAIRFYRRLGADAKAKLRFTLALEEDYSSLRPSSPITLGVPT